MKEKFEIKNLLDKRYSRNQTFMRWFNKYTLASLVDGIILGSLFGLFIADNPYKQPSNTSLNDVKSTIEVKAVEVTPKKEMTWEDAIREVFPKDEAGLMIRICLREHRGWKGDPKYALNDKNTNGTWDYGWCQVNSCHKPSKMTDYEWKEYLEDPMNNANEVRRIYLSQGWWAWSVYKYGGLR